MTCYLKYLLIMELGFDAILYSTLGNENSERKYAYYVNKRRQNVSLET